jgi:hypothetical protein
MVRILYTTVGSQAVPGWVLAIQESRMPSHLIWPHFKYSSFFFSLIELTINDGLMRIDPDFQVKSNVMLNINTQPL